MIGVKVILYLYVLISGITAPIVGAYEKLDRQNANLLLQIAAQHRALDPLVQKWLAPKDLDVNVSADPLSALLRQVSTLGAEARTMHVDVVNHQGQLWGWEAECVAFGHVYGHEGAFVEFADPNYTLQSSLTLSNLAPGWLPGRGFQLQAQADAIANLGMLRGNRYPCIGGGVTVNGGPATCSASTKLATVALIDGLTPTGVAFHLSISSSQIPVDCDISLGSLGTLRIHQMLPDFSASSQGSFDLPFGGSGSLIIPLPTGNVTRAYQFSVLSPQLAVTDTGLHAGADLKLSWQ